ncbi:MAG: thioredoxin domain-containing protein, partial [Acidobacteria bacterium]|nr:thioredoxin domain-containing protein [Acidobacteriota bacterium]
MKLKLGRIRTILDVAGGIGMLAVSCMLLWTFLRPPASEAELQDRTKSKQVQAGLEPPAGPVSLEGADIVGLPTAAVTVVEFSDFQCPFCQKFSVESLPTISKSLIETGKIRLAFRHFPLSIHPGAMAAASVAECASQQGVFWNVHDRLFSLPRTAGSNDYIAASVE